MQKIYLEQILLPRQKQSTKESFSKLVCEALHKPEDEKLQNKIDEQVAKFYDLTADEVLYIKHSLERHKAL